jgi:hypothetical protein
VCCIYATAPFLQPADLRRGLQVLTDTGADFAFSVTRYAFPIQRAIRVDDRQRVEMFHPDQFNTRSQDLEEAWHDAGQFYWGRADAWLSGKPIFGRDSAAVPLPRHLVQDIDTPEDWERAEWMLKAFKPQPRPPWQATKPDEAHASGLSHRRLGRHRHRPCHALPDAGRRTPSPWFGVRVHLSTSSRTPDASDQGARSRGSALAGAGRHGRGRQTPTAHARWLGVPWELDAQDVQTLLADTGFDWLVTDHYALDCHWEQALRHRCTRLMVIDDLADRRHDCDLLLDQNLGRSAADYAPDSFRCTLGNRSSTRPATT